MSSVLSSFSLSPCSSIKQYKIQDVNSIRRSRLRLQASWLADPREECWILLSNWLPSSSCKSKIQFTFQMPMYCHFMITMKLSVLPFHGFDEPHCTAISWLRWTSMYCHFMVTTSLNVLPFQGYDEPHRIAISWLQWTSMYCHFMVTMNFNILPFHG